LDYSLIKNGIKIFLLGVGIQGPVTSVKMA